MVQTKAYGTVVSVGAGRPPVYQVRPGFARACLRIRSCLSTRQWPPQVKVRGGELEAHAEAELIGLADELGEWLCAAAAAPSDLPTLVVWRGKRACLVCVSVSGYVVASMVYSAHMIVFARNHRTLECKFAADVAGAVQAALAAEDIRSLDDVVDVLDEARLGNQSAAAVRPAPAVASVQCAARCVQGLLAGP